MTPEQRAQAVVEFYARLSRELYQKHNCTRSDALKLTEAAILSGMFNN
jgi:hypothetical protein